MNRHRARPHPRRQPRVPARRAVVTLAAVAVLTLAAGPARAADAPSSAAATREDLGQADPLNAPGQTLYLQRVTIPAGTKLVDHFHEGTQVARVVKGVLTYDVISGTVRITRRDGSTESVTGPTTVKIRSGESLTEVQSLAHTGANAGKKPVVIEIAALLAKGAPLATPIGQATAGTVVTLGADLTSQSTQLHTVGADGAGTYGWNRLTGVATDATGPVDVELLGSVMYDGGSGPFWGFVTFTFADGSVLGTQVQGVATRGADGVTQFASTLGVINGTGRYLNTTGTGTFTGSRNAALGQPVGATFELSVVPRK